MLQAKLKVVGGKHHGKSIAVPKGKFLIGREQDCQLRPNSELVSRHHCVINIDDFTVRLRDLGSTNGTFVNGNRVRGEVTLKAGDRVRVGKLDFEILIPDPNAVETAPVVTGDSSRSLSSTSETTQLSTSETSFEIPLPGDLPDSGSSVLPSNGDTTVIGPMPTMDDTGTVSPAPPVPYAQDPYQQMPQYPQQPMYQQPAYPWMQPQMPYPGTAYPQYGMPYQQPGMYPGQMGMYPPQAAAAPAAPPSAVTTTPSDDMAVIPVKLPDPKTTGANKLAPPTEASAPPADPASRGTDPKSTVQVKPSEKAADIIKSYMHRKPGV
ncbi:MAG: FHA domain-containing protein [Planctomycetaceae bacterium]